MSTKYDIYLMEHRMGVRKALMWLSTRMPEIFSELSTTESEELRYYIQHHDESKERKDEYIAYDIDMPTIVLGSSSEPTPPDSKFTNTLVLQTQDGY